MRIALIPSAYSPAVGGVEQLTHQLAQRRIAAGDSVEVWVHRHPRELPARETIDGVPVKRFTLPLPSAQIRRLASFPVGAAGALRQLRRAAMEFRPDVLHVQCFSGNGLYASALAPLTGKPLVVSLQGETVMDDQDIYEHSMTLRVALRLGLKRAAAVTGCSQFVLDDAVARFGLPADKGLVVPNGVEPSESMSPIPLALPFERFVFGVGRVVEKKGFDLLLESYAQVAQARHDVGLVIGGEGAARAGLIDRARDLGLADRVVFPGNLSRGEIAWSMQSAAVFVLPSRLEPFGIVVVEALQGGRPVIVSSRGGAGEIVRDGREGLSVDPLDTAALAAAILRVLDDDALSDRLGQAAKSRARDFEWARIAERYGDVYRGVI